MAYVTLEEAKTYLGIATDADDGLLTTLLGAAQATVERYCDRVFEAPADETRKFDCMYPVVIGWDLFLDRDLCYVTEIVNGDGETIGSEEVIEVPQTPPYFALRLLSSTGKVWTYETDREQAIAITGRWAYSITPPSPVVQAVKELIGWMYRSYDRQGGSDATAFREASETLPGNVQMWLEGYRRL